jgi:hypothetical protein
MSQWNGPWTMCAPAAAWQEILNIVHTESEYPVLSRFFGSFNQAEIQYLSKSPFMNVPVHTHMQVLNVLVQLIMIHMLLLQYFSKFDLYDLEKYVNSKTWVSCHVSFLTRWTYDKNLGMIQPSSGVRALHVFGFGPLVVKPRIRLDWNLVCEVSWPTGTHVQSFRTIEPCYETCHANGQWQW